MAGTVIADNLQAAATSTLVIKNGVASTPPTIQDSAGTEIGTFCRAWVNFNGTGTVAIRDSFNVSSITDNGTGDYTVNFTNAMSDANFGFSISSSSAQNINKAAAGWSPGTNQTASLIRVFTRTGSSNAEDPHYVSVAIFR
jgi:hypothetical protein